MLTFWAFSRSVQKFVDIFANLQIFLQALMILSTFGLENMQSCNRHIKIKQTFYSKWRKFDKRYLQANMNYYQI